MWCPQCGTDTRVLETDKLDQVVTRVRWCRNGGCRFLFETHEVVSGKVVREEVPDQLVKSQAKGGVFLGGESAAKPKGGRTGGASAKGGGAKSSK